MIYVLGIPLGISSAVPILLQNRGVSYSEQAGFTFAYYPYTSESLLFYSKLIKSRVQCRYLFASLIVKILWAPIVDSVYFKSFGLRKSWLIPTQIAIGLFMLIVAQNIDEWMGNGAGKGPQMILLTSVFFVLWFLAATQDVAVDGWALTMLKRENVGFAGTCNAGNFFQLAQLQSLITSNFQQLVEVQVDFSDM